jgi:hypothetical protein
MKYIELCRGVILASLLAIVSTRAADEPAQHYRYENAERTGYFGVDGEHAILDRTESRRHPVVEDAGADNVLFSALDCSDSEFRCFKSQDFVLAIPKRGLHGDDKYTVMGAQFSVLKCLRTAGGICEVAIMQSDCQNKKNPYTCEPYVGGRKAAPYVGELVYFIYNEDYGVTALGFWEGRIEATEEHKQELTRQYILTGDKGLLRP